jgi:hypothetical protein
LRVAIGAAHAAAQRGHDVDALLAETLAGLPPAIHRLGRES